MSEESTLLDNGLSELLITEPFFDQARRAERMRKAELLLKKAHTSKHYKSKADKTEHYRKAVAAFHRCFSEAFPPDFFKSVALLKKRDVSGLEAATKFLENDPWFFRAGYVKADLASYIARVELSDNFKNRLRRVVLNAIDLRYRREFRHYARLAKKLNEPKFKAEILKRFESADPDVRRRASWVLRAIEVAL